MKGHMKKKNFRFGNHLTRSDAKLKPLSPSLILSVHLDLSFSPLKRRPLRVVVRLVQSFVAFMRCSKRRRNSGKKRQKILTQRGKDCRTHSRQLISTSNFLLLLPSILLSFLPLALCLQSTTSTSSSSCCERMREERVCVLMDKTRKTEESRLKVMNLHPVSLK